MKFVSGKLQALFSLSRASSALETEQAGAPSSCPVVLPEKGTFCTPSMKLTHDMRRVYTKIVDFSAQDGIRNSLLLHID
jgi:hypothetical protein